MGAQVVVELGGSEVLRVPLKGPSMVIGRDPSADVHLDNRALSRRHAQLEKRGAAIWIRDLGSQNGTFVNGERVEGQRALNMGDVIELGRYQLSISGVEQAADNTPVLTLTGPEGKHRFAMVGDEIIIGRAPSCDIAIGHKSISRRHLRISLENGAFVAEDLGSQNGTRIRGKRITGPTPFAPGEPLQMSEFTIELGFLAGDGEAARNDAASGDRANKTMMIDRSELAKAAYVDGDFERMRSSAGRLALGRPDHPETGRHNEHREGNTGELALSDEESQTRGLPSPIDIPAPPAPPPPAAAPAPPPPPAPAVAPPPPPPAPAPVSSPGRKVSAPWVMVAHPDLDDRELDLSGEVTLLGEDGTTEDRSQGRAWADQGYLLFTRSNAGVVVTVIGDRRLVTVNGKPQLFARLTEGDTVEFGLLTAIFHA